MDVCHEEVCHEVVMGGGLAGGIVVDGGVLVQALSRVVARMMRARRESCIYDIVKG